MPLHLPPYMAGDGENAAVQRVESGGIQFGDDWPGLFLRGDNSFHLMMTIETLYRLISPAILDTHLLSQEERNAIHIAMMHLKALGDMIDEEVIVKPQELPPNGPK